MWGIPAEWFTQRTASDRTLGLVLAIGLLHGLIYVFLVPPWQHYDEPGHFEYAWLIAEQNQIPKPGSVDPGLRRELAASMLEYDFFEELGFSPRLFASAPDIWIGPTQLGDPPLYYFLASLPLNFLSYTEISNQVLILRIFSLTLYLLTLFTCWKLIADITPVTSPLRWLVPLSTALIPGFVDIMTSVNNDVGATAFFSLFLWTAIRALESHRTKTFLAASVLLALLSLFTKQTVWVCFPLILFWVALSRSRITNKHRTLIIMLSMGLVMITACSLQDASLWHRRTLQQMPTRLAHDLAPQGQHVAMIQSSPDLASPNLVQFIPPEDYRSLRGKAVSIGVWMWANEPVSVRGPNFHTQNHAMSSSFDIGTAPKFYTASHVVPDADHRAWISLSPFKESPAETVTVYLDSLILVPGVWSPEDLRTESIRNGGKRGDTDQAQLNLIRNASFEQPWPATRWWLNSLGVNWTGTWPSFFVGSFFDWDGMGWYYEITAARLIRTFWAQFGWGNVNLIGSRPYLFPALMTVVGVVVAFAFMRRLRQILPQNAFALLGISLVSIWTLTTMRGLGSLSEFELIPVARLAYPAIIPTMLLLCFGWLQGINVLNRMLKIPKRILLIMLILYFVILDVQAIWSISSAYY